MSETLAPEREYHIRKPIWMEQDTYDGLLFIRDRMYESSGVYKWWDVVLTTVQRYIGDDFVSAGPIVSEIAAVWKDHPDYDPEKWDF